MIDTARKGKSRPTSSKERERKGPLRMLNEAGWEDEYHVPVSRKGASIFERQFGLFDSCTLHLGHHCRATLLLSLWINTFSRTHIVLPIPLSVLMTAGLEAASAVCLTMPSCPIFTCSGPSRERVCPPQGPSVLLRISMPFCSPTCPPRLPCRGHIRACSMHR